MPLEVSKIILSRILGQALYFVRGGAVDHERGGASRDRENHLWDAHDAHPLLRTARSSGHRMATVIEVNAVFSTGSRPALKTMGLPDRGWSVGSTKSEQLHDVKSVMTVTFAMCQTVKPLYANLIFGVKIYNSRPARTSSRECVCGQTTQPLADVENKMKRRRTGAGIIDVTGSGLESISCLGEIIHQEWTESLSGRRRLR